MPDGIRTRFYVDQGQTASFGKAGSMESMRDVNRVMEREAAKGSCPLKLDGIRIGKDSYREITSREKLLEVAAYLLRTGEFGSYAGKTAASNVYLDARGRKASFKRAKTAPDRKALLAAAGRHAAKRRPGFNGDVFLETAGCYFTLAEEDLVKYRYTYGDRETYAFTMSDRYILGLYTLCLAARKEMAGGVEAEMAGCTDKELSMMKLESIRDVLFQCLLLDNVQLTGGRICAELCTVYLLSEEGCTG